MNKKNLFLVAGILALITFIGYLTESEPKEMFGFYINIWIMRIGWLFLTISFFSSYLKLKNLDKGSD